GMRTVLDLRTPAELDERGRFTHDSVGYHHLPILETTWDRDALYVEVDVAEFLAARYLEMLEEGRESIGRALRILADPASLPLVFHCAAGKDRTGVVAAIVLDLLGVRDDDIADDYSLSRLGMDRFRAWIIETYPEAADAMSDQPQAFLDAPAEAMHLFLAGLREQHGSVYDYAVSLGVSGDVLHAVRENLLTLA
ncbi:MAG TPA: tyrosine-protein phosphatase, partial [Acidimicrobiales bacterium]|nr:tyrosine-protein phosphatase [Acidimicrobiales bacterium]